MASFESVVDEYDAARPAYPPGIYDSSALSTAVVLDGGAGTGIATRQLIARGAAVIALDSGQEVLTRAASHTSGLKAVVADGAELPFRDASIDLTCFAQAWHWLDEATRCVEAHRVLRQHGRWAGWWSHARADGTDWFDAYWSLIEAACPGTHRSQRDIDWGTGVAESGLFEVSERVTVPWMREITVDNWMTDQASHSYIVALSTPNRERLLRELRTVLHKQFPNGKTKIPYETWLWIARKL